MYLSVSPLAGERVMTTPPRLSNSPHAVDFVLQHLSVTARSGLLYFRQDSNLRLLV